MILLRNILLSQMAGASGWDISGAVYDDIFLSTYQTLGNSGIFIGDDGKKLYTTGTAWIYQYTMSTPWDLNSCSYDGVFGAINGQQVYPRSVFFSPDGLKMYIVGSYAKVFQFELSVPWVVSSISYNSNYCDVSDTENSPYGLTFSSDGSKFYICSGVSDAIYQFDMVAPWDVSTGGYASKYFSVAPPEYDSLGIYLCPDGYKLFMFGKNPNAVHQFDLTIENDVSSASYNSISKDISAEGYNEFGGVFFSPDGNKMFIVGGSTNRVYQYSL